MTGDKVFLDTNILIYAHDISAGKKYEVAKNILLNLWNEGNGLLSTQVLQEFFIAVTKKTKKLLSVKIARDTILGAIDIHLQYQYSFWDSMIIHSAMSGGADLLLSEDLADGQIIKGVKISTPFKTT